MSQPATLPSVYYIRRSQDWCEQIDMFVNDQATPDSLLNGASDHVTEVTLTMTPLPGTVSLTQVIWTYTGGKIQMDDQSVGWQLDKVTDVQSSLLEGDYDMLVSLHWQSGLDEDILSARAKVIA